MTDDYIDIDCIKHHALCMGFNVSSSKIGDITFEINGTCLIISKSLRLISHRTESLTLKYRGRKLSDAWLTIYFTKWGREVKNEEEIYTYVPLKKSNKDNVSLKSNKTFIGVFK